MGKDTVENLKDLVATNLGRLRQKAGLTRGDLAERSGVGESAIQRTELGQCVPDLRTLALLADALGVGVGVLFRKR